MSNLNLAAIAALGSEEKLAARDYVADKPDFADPAVAGLVRMAFLQGILWERNRPSELIAALQLLVDSHTKTTDAWPCIVAAQAALSKTRKP